MKIHLVIHSSYGDVVGVFTDLEAATQSVNLTLESLKAKGYSLTEADHFTVVDREVKSSPVDFFPLLPPAGK